MSQHEEWVMNQVRISELKVENVQLREIINAHNKKMSEGVYTTNEQCAKEVAEHDRLLAENSAQALRIFKLEERMCVLSAGSRQKVYAALNRRYKEILSLRKESAAQAKRIAELEETNGLLQTQVHCLEIVAASKNGE